MRNRFEFLGPVISYLGALLMGLGLLLMVPWAVRLWYLHMGRAEVTAGTYIAPAALAVVSGWLLRHRGQKMGGGLRQRGAMMICALAWTVLSAVGALPFCISLGAGYLDAYFETVSGFTTTGITMFTGLDEMPHSIILWRALLQWFGGLGILTFFLMVVGAGAQSHRLFSAEAHKIFSRRPAPSLQRTLKILWGIYGLLTVLVAVLLVLAGTTVFDAVAHAMTCLSTGGFSPYDASIAHYREAGYRYYVAIEYILIFGMFCGGLNFFIHFRALTGDLESLWDNLEVRLYWLILLGGAVVVWFDRSLEAGFVEIERTFRTSLFQVVSVATTTGYGTEDIGSGYFPALSMQFFLILMLIGGCVGSTGGGIKVMRVGVLLKMVKRQVRRVVLGRRATNLLLIDGDTIEPKEIRRIAALFFAWCCLLAVGAGITALFNANHGPLESASGMFSALGNIGPCYIPVEEMNRLHWLTKITYIFGMLAGRLEILPVLMLFSRWSWR
ncbi:MAG: TrkH family potassium uptake protein [Candidatus Brocadiia bacterium]